MPLILPTIFANCSISSVTFKESDSTSTSSALKKKFKSGVLSFFKSIKLSEKKDILFFSNDNFGLYKSTAITVYLSYAK